MGQLVIVGAVVEPDLAELLLWSCFTAVVGIISIYSGLCRSRVKVTPRQAVPRLASCASSGRAWRLWAACTPRGRGQPTGRKSLPRVLALAASKVAHFPAL